MQTIISVQSVLSSSNGIGVLALDLHIHAVSIIISNFMY